MLTKVTVDPSFWELFPNAQVNVMLVSDIDNHDTDDNLSARRKLLSEAEDKAEDFLGAAQFNRNAVIDEWRKAYQQFAFGPQLKPCSSEWTRAKTCSQFPR